MKSKTLQKIFKRGISDNYSINMSLVNRQKLESESIDKIRKLQSLRNYIYDIIDDMDDINKIKELVNFLTELEFQLQRLWGFPENKDFHRWWEVPKCSCPYMDNADNLGTKRRIYSSSCIIHGS